MARFLAIDWDQNQLHLISANVGSNVVKVQRAAVWEEQKSPNPSDAELLGKLLRERLKDAGISPAPVLACIGRDRVVVKDIRYPAVPEAEEANIVRFQAYKEMNDAADDVVLDYMNVGSPDATGEQRAIVLIVRKEVVQTYQALCQSAGLRLAGLTPRPFGLAATIRKVMGSTALTPKPEPADAPVAIVTVAERWAEFCVVRGDQLLMARSLAVGPTLAGEVRRSLTVYAGQSGQQPVAALYVAGAVAELRQRLNDMMPELPIHSFDPFSGADVTDLAPAQRGAFAGAAGLLIHKSEPRGLPINFVAPREAKPVKDVNRERVLVWAGVAVMALVAIVVLAWNVQAGLERDLKSLRETIPELDKKLVAAKEKNRLTKTLLAWDSLPWLDEIYDLVHRIGDVDAIKVTSVTFEPVIRGKGNDVGRLIIRGTLVKNDRRPLELLRDEFRKDGYYSPEAPFVERNNFSLKVNVERRDPSEYKRKLKSAL